MQKFLIPLMTLAMLAACNDDGNEDVIPDEKPACKIQTITSVNDLGGTTTLTLVYNQDGDIISIEEKFEGGSTTDSYELDFTYSDGRIVSAKYPDDEEDDEGITVVYDGNKISKIVLGDPTYTIEWRFVYDGDQVVSLEEWDNYKNQEELVLFSTENFTYTDGNLTNIELTINKAACEDCSDETYTYVYDEKSNPFYEDVAWLLWNQDWESYFSKNNVLKEVYERATETYTQTATYTYNEEGFPVSAGYINSEDDTWSDQVVYECDSE